LTAVLYQIVSSCTLCGTASIINRFSKGISCYRYIYNNFDSALWLLSLMLETHFFPGTCMLTSLSS